MLHAQPSPPPGFHVYDGQVIPLELRPDRVAVRYRHWLEEPDALATAARAGVPLAAAPAVGVSSWRFLDLADRGAAGVAQVLRQLRAAPDVEFAAPVFHRGGDWIFPLEDVYAKVDPDFAGDASFLAALAPGWDVEATEFPEDTFRLRGGAEDGSASLALATFLCTDPRVLWAEPDMMFTGRGDHIPDDPGFPSLWGMHNTGQFGGTAGIDMDGDTAWDLTTGNATVKVLVLDVGVEQGHADLSTTPGMDFTGEGGGGGPFNVCDNHGTAVAGCISARIDNGRGTVGIAPDCVVLSARTFVSSLLCDGSWTTQTSWTVGALQWGAGQGARVSNNANTYGFMSNCIKDAYAQTRAGGMIHFASAGNDGAASLSYPASLADVNAVSAVTPGGQRASFSNQGSGMSLSAPGQDVLTTDRTGGAGLDPGDTVLVSGTSFSCAYASGVAALVLSREPSLSVPELESRLRRTARDLGPAGFDSQFGWGMVNAEAALRREIRVPDLQATVQGGLSVAADGDTVLVEPGTYFEVVDFLGKAVTLQSRAGAASTVLNGAPGGSVVSFQSGEGSGSILQGFTITQGSAVAGGGVFCGPGSAPVIQDCVLEANSCGTFGGGLFAADASPTLRDCTISGNFASLDGGGLYAGGQNGGGAVVLERCRSEDNVAQGNGGGMACVGPVQVTLRDCLLADNSALLFGGGCVWSLGASVQLSYCTIAQNAALLGGGGIGGNAGAVAGDHCILWSNVPDSVLELVPGVVSLRYSDVGGGWPGPGNLDLAPQFVAPVLGDFALRAASPCIDAGDPAERPATQDQAGNPRYLDGNLDGVPRTDLGAYEFTNLVLAANGPAIRGQSVLVGTSGTPGAGVLLLIGTAPGSALFGRFGYLQIDVTAPWISSPWAPVNSSLSVTIPAGLPSGLELYLQALGTFAGAGNLSNSLLLEIQ